MKRRFLCLVPGAFTLLAGLVLYGIVAARPDPVEGTDRPEWLPPAASQVFHRSQSGFGHWQAAEFSIPREDLLAYAAGRGWSLQPQENYSPVNITRVLLRPAGRVAADEDFQLIPHALVYEKRAGSGGGVTLVYDPATSRAYYYRSHR